MKKIKKILALTLAILILMSAMAVQSFALFDKELPTVESVEFIDENPISLKALKNYFDQAEEWYDPGEMPMDEPCYLYLDTNFAYEIEITFSNGDVQQMMLEDYFLDCGDYCLYVEAHVYYEDYLEATAGDDIDVSVSIGVESSYSIVNDYFSEEFVLQKETVSCYVLSMIPLSIMPSILYKNCDYYDIEGAKFLVTYANLKTETLTISVEKNENDYPEYFLGDKLIDIYVDDLDEVYTFGFSFYDEKYSKRVTVKDEPFESISITECDFDVNKKELSSIKCEVTLKDGTVQTVEKTFDEPLTTTDYAVIGVVKDYVVTVFVDDFEIVGDNTFLTDNFCITVEVGYDEAVSDTYRVENPLSFFVAIRMFFVKIYIIIEEFIFNILPF